ncbi:MAG: FkbM family methyltransferase [Tepidisphaeraceae bacterium]|jgi:FkbM family methyltransferase
MTQGPDPFSEKTADLQRELWKTEIQLWRTQQLLAAVQAESILQSQRRQPRMQIEFRAQFAEDVWAWDLLGKQTEGFFIEAGAFDGLNFSVTYALEAMGWNGLLVEANPQPAQRCAARRPHSRVVHAALDKQAGGTTDLWVVQDRYGGMMSYTKISASQLQSVGPMNRSVISVPRATLNDLLADHHGDIDLVVLDLEGAEWDTLQAFDLLRFRPRLLLIEQSTATRPIIQDFMKARSYHGLGALLSNGIYARSDQVDVIKRFKFLTGQ